jgi:exosortase
VILRRESFVQWGRAVVLAGLFIAFFFHFFKQMGAVALSDDNWSHALLVPLVSVYFLYDRRLQWRAIPLGSDWRGLWVLLAGMALYVVGFYPISNLMVRGYGMLISLLGLGWLLTGRRMRVFWFPIAYLVFGIKIGDRIWGAIAGQLQEVAAHGAAAVLQLAGLDAVVRGATIELLGAVNEVAALNVAEACSGLRMLMAFVAMGVAVAYLFDRPWWARAVLILCGIPVALVSNIFRVSILGLLFRVNPEWLHGPAHAGVGLLMILLGLGLFNGLGWLLDHLFVEAEDVSA